MARRVPPANNGANGNEPQRSIDLNAWSRQIALQLATEEEELKRRQAAVREVELRIAELRGQLLLIPRLMTQDPEALITSSGVSTPEGERFGA